MQYFFSENAATPCGGWLNPNIGQPNCTCLVHNVSTFNIFEVTMRKICPFYLGTLKKILSVTLLYKSAKTWKDRKQGYLHYFYSDTSLTGTIVNRVMHYAILNWGRRKTLHYISLKHCLGSGSAKICGSMDPDPRGKISTKNYKKKITPKTQIWTFEKERLYKFPHFWMVHQVLG